MQSGFVDFVSEQEQAIELAKYLDKVRAVKAQQAGSEAPTATLLASCTQLVKDSKFLDVLANLLKESGDLFAAGQEKGSSFRRAWSQAIFFLFSSPRLLLDK